MSRMGSLIVELTMKDVFRNELEYFDALPPRVRRRVDEGIFPINSADVWKVYQNKGEDGVLQWLNNVERIIKLKLTEMYGVVCDEEIKARGLQTT